MKQRATSGTAGRARLGLNTSVVVAAMAMLAAIIPMIAASPAAAADSNTPYLFSNPENISMGTVKSPTSWMGFAGDSSYVMQNSLRGLATEEHFEVGSGNPAATDRVTTAGSIDWDGGGHGDTIVETAVGYLSSDASVDTVVVTQTGTALAELHWYGPQNEGIPLLETITLPSTEVVGLAIIGQHDVRYPAEIHAGGIAVATASTVYVYEYLNGSLQTPDTWQPVEVDSEFQGAKLIDLHHSPSWAETTTAGLSTSSADVRSSDDNADELFLVTYWLPSTQGLKTGVMRYHDDATIEYIGTHSILSSTLLPFVTPPKADMRYRFDASHSSPHRYMVLLLQETTGDQRSELLFRQGDAGFRPIEEIIEDNGEGVFQPGSNTTFCNYNGGTTAFDATFFPHTHSPWANLGLFPVALFPRPTVEIRISCAGRSNGGPLKMDSARVLSTQEGLTCAAARCELALVEARQVDVENQFAGGTAGTPQVNIEVPCFEIVMQSGGSPDACNWTYGEDGAGDVNKFISWNRPHTSIVTAATPAGPAAARSTAMTWNCEGGSFGLYFGSQDLTNRYSRSFVSAPTCEMGARWIHDQPVFMPMKRLPSLDVEITVALDPAHGWCGEGDPSQAWIAANGNPTPCSPRLVTVDPVPMAVLVAPPLVGGANQEQLGSLSAPEFTVSTGNTGSTSSTLSGSVGASVGFEAEDPLGIAGGSAKVTVEGSLSGTTQLELGITLADSYSGNTQDHVVVYAGTRAWQYDTIILENSAGQGIGDTTTFTIPFGDAIIDRGDWSVLSADPTVEDAFGPQGTYRRGIEGILSSERGPIVPGNPGTYLRGPGNGEIDNYCNGRVAPIDQQLQTNVPLPPLPQILKDVVQEVIGVNLNNEVPKFEAPAVKGGQTHVVTYGQTGSESSAVTFDQSLSESSLAEISIKQEGEAKLGGATAGASRSASFGIGFSATASQGTMFDASVGDIPEPRNGNGVLDQTAAALLQGETYSWDYFVCQKDVLDGAAIWVANFAVDGYFGIGGLDSLARPTVTNQFNGSSTDTTPTFSFSHGSGTVENYDIKVTATSCAVGFTQTRTVQELTLAEARDRTTPSTMSYTWPASAELPGDCEFDWTVSARDFFGNTRTSAIDAFRTSAVVPTPKCKGNTATVVIANGDQPTNGADVIIGTDGDDTIDGLGGDDIICGFGGADTLSGGEGRDYIYGGAGADVIFGGSEIDRIWGDAGGDTIYGDGGSDRLRGGDGNDTVHAGSGADRVYGGAGGDTLNGMGGQDQMWGDSGHDTMQGNHQSDVMYGGSGNDVIRASGGKDELFGESGVDELFGGDNSDTLNGGAGNDHLDGQKGRDTCLSGGGTDTRNSC